MKRGELMEDLIRDTLQELQIYNRKLIPAVEKAVNYFRTQREDQGFKLLSSMMEGLQWTIEVVFRTQELLQGYDVEVDEKKVNKVLQDLLEATENQDTVSLADILEYEILESLKYWQTGVDRMFAANN